MIGVDLVKISRVAALSPSARAKIFHPSEINGASDRHLAAVFAIKECCKKIFGADMPWHSVEVKRTPSGAPQAVLSSSLQKQFTHVEVSATHEGDFAAAVVVAWK